MAPSVFKNLIKKDMDTFGSKDSDKIPADLNHFQQDIEDSQPPILGHFKLIIDAIYEFNYYIISLPAIKIL